MPGRLFLTTPPDALARLLGADAGAVADEPPRRNVAPGQEVLAMASERRLVRMRWGLIPQGRRNARGRPVMETLINARSETLFAKTAFAGLRRCVVPVDGWYEWTGKARRKTAWAIAARDGAPLIFAAVYDVWQGPGGVAVPQVATVTCAPSADVREVHDRMGVLLAPEAVGQWLDGAEEDAARLMRPWPDGRLVVEEARDVDWAAG